VEVARKVSPSGRLQVLVSVRPGEHVWVTVPWERPSEEQVRRAVEAVLRTVDLSAPPPETFQT
jgi:hypothetical protein